MTTNKYPTQELSDFEMSKLERHELLMQDTSDLDMAVQFAESLGKNESLLTSASLERFRWLAAREWMSAALPNDPLMVQLTETVNPNYILTMAEKCNVDIPKAAELVAEQIDSTIERLVKARENLAKAANTKRFFANEFEPSIFGGLGGYPNTDWCLWYAKQHNTGIVHAHTVGIDLIKHLNDELPRMGTSEDPTPGLIVMSPEFRKAGIKRGSLSLNWVIHRKYKYNLTWDDAHAKGISIILSLPESEIAG